MSGGVGAVKYTPAQREACGAACAGGLRDWQVAELAAAGRLELNGMPLEAFHVPASTVRHHKRSWLRSEAARQAAIDLADRAPRDAVEILRRDLLDVTKREIEHVKRVQRDEGFGIVSPERLRQLGRALLELARLPGPSDPRPVPGTTKDASGQRIEVRGGPVGRLLDAHRGTTGGRRPPTPMPEPVQSVMVERAPSEEPDPVPAHDDEHAKLVAAVGEATAARLERMRADATDSPQAGQDAPPVSPGYPLGNGKRDEFDYSRLPAVDDSAITGITPRVGRRGRMRGW